jgi:hypothetical protein
VDALALLMTDQTRTHCRHVAERFHGGDALETAAKLVEGLAHRPLRPPKSIDCSAEMDVGIDQR